MPMITMGPWNKVKGGLLARGGGQARSSEGREEGRTGGTGIIFPSLRHLSWSGWVEKKLAAGEGLFPPPTMYTLFEFSTIMIRKRTETCSTETGGNESWWNSCSAENELSLAGCSFSVGNKIRKEEEQEGLKEKNGTNNHLENMCERDEWIH